MSCWVVPSLAAELWRMPLEQVMKLVREGAVPRGGWIGSSVREDRRMPIRNTSPRLDVADEELTKRWMQAAEPPQ